GVRSKEKELRPSSIVELARIIGARDVRFSTAAKLDLWAFATIRAVDEEHGTSVRHGRCGGLVDQPPRREAFERERRVDGMWFARCKRMGKDICRSGRCFEAARAPPTVDVETFDRRAADDWRSVWRHIYDAAPRAHHLHASELRKQ